MKSAMTILLLVMSCVPVAAREYDQAYWTARNSDNGPSGFVNVTAYLRDGDGLGRGSTVINGGPGILSGIVELNGNEFTVHPLEAVIPISGSQESQPIRAWVPGTTDFIEFTIGLSVDSQIAWETTNSVTYQLRPRSSDKWDVYWNVASQSESMKFVGTSFPVDWWIDGPQTRITGTGEVTCRAGEVSQIAMPSDTYHPGKFTDGLGGLCTSAVVFDGLLDGVPMQLRLDGYSWYYLVPEPAFGLTAAIGFGLLAACCRTHTRR